jgi:hypothetical protein
MTAAHRIALVPLGGRRELAVTILRASAGAAVDVEVFSRTRGSGALTTTSFRATLRPTDIDLVVSALKLAKSELMEGVAA